MTEPTREAMKLARTVLACEKDGRCGKRVNTCTRSVVIGPCGCCESVVRVAALIDRELARVREAALLWAARDAEERAALPQEMNIMEPHTWRLVAAWAYGRAAAIKSEPLYPAERERGDGQA